MTKKKTGLIFITALIICFYFFDLGYLVKAVKVGYLKGHTTAYLSDYVHFDNDTIKTGIHQPWLISNKYNSKVESENLININKFEEKYVKFEASYLNFRLKIKKTFNAILKVFFKKLLNILI